jgi:hypothetical protein
MLIILNLPPWLCNKQKYIMMSGLIPGPQQPKKNIDTYFRPLVEDLKELWYNNKVLVWDEHKREYFDLKAILFVTVSDSPPACNLFGQNKKVGCRCPHCFRETDLQYLSESRKIVYMGHRRYIPIKHHRTSLTTTLATPIMLKNRGSGNKRMKDWPNKVLRIYTTNSMDGWDHLCVLVLS